MEARANTDAGAKARAVVAAKTGAEADSVTRLILFITKTKLSTQIKLELESILLCTFS